MSDGPILTIAPASGASAEPGRGYGFPTWLGALVLGMALVAGVALKIVTVTRSPHEQADLRGRISLFLEQHGYRLLTAERDSTGLARVAAVAGRGCRMLVVQARAQGWDQHSIRQETQAFDNFFMVFEGALYDAHPTWRAKAYSYWDRALRHVGIAAPERPMLAVIAAPACSARGLPWQNLWSSVL